MSKEQETLKEMNPEELQNKLEKAQKEEKRLQKKVEELDLELKTLKKRKEVLESSLKIEKDAKREDRSLTEEERRAVLDGSVLCAEQVLDTIETGIPSASRVFKLTGGNRKVFNKHYERLVNDRKMYIALTTTNGPDAKEIETKAGPAIQELIERLECSSEEFATFAINEIDFKDVDRDPNSWYRNLICLDDDNNLKAQIDVDKVYESIKEPFQEWKEAYERMRVLKIPKLRR